MLLPAVANAIQCGRMRKLLEVKMELLQCPYLGWAVELTDEREQHIRARHSDLMPAHREYIAVTLSDPEHVQISPNDANARIFTRWFAELTKYVIVIVVSDSSSRDWIITARIARRPAKGATEWQRN